jgi:hypothetical protein
VIRVSVEIREGVLTRCGSWATMSAERACHPAVVALPLGLASARNTWISWNSRGARSGSSSSQNSPPQRLMERSKA